MYTLPKIWAVVLAPNRTSRFQKPARRPSQFLSVRSAPRAPSLPHPYRRCPLRPQRDSASAASCRPSSPLPSSPLRQQRKGESGQREIVRRRSEARRCSPRSARSSSGRRRNQILTGCSCFPLRIDYPWYQILLDPNLAQLLWCLTK